MSSPFVESAMNDAIIKAFEESIQAKRSFLKENLNTLVTVINLLAAAFSNGNKFLLFGTGGVPQMHSISLLSLLTVFVSRDDPCLPWH